MPSLHAKADPTRPISVTELFTVGIGPSSSHTVGPMRAARVFAEGVADRGVASLSVTLHGSLALTGRGHATDRAVLLGLAGFTPEGVDPDAVPAIVAAIHGERALMLAGRQAVPFDPAIDLVFDKAFLPGHPNGMTCVAVLDDGASVTRRFYSIGGGAIVEDGVEPARLNIVLPYPFSSGEQMLALTAETGLTIADLERANEATWRAPAETEAFLDGVRAAMVASIERGCRSDGVLPGGLEVPRRAKALHDKLVARGPRSDPSTVFDWVSLWALAVNEENAAGGRVVTAPTNGAAGVIPAVLRYYETFVHGATPRGAHDLLLTASAIGCIYKKRASISAAEMGCQGEVGVACSMAAGGLAAALGGTPGQIENAAEIGMEHNLGLTCDPIGGLVQIPCIERNTMGAIKAINAAYLALHGNGSHIVSLDAVIETMRQTGEDMRSKYKETSLGGLAVNVVEC
ncbi:L-serine ammonia-lyase [Sphingomonas immobilis]|uniref:L-serine dehydratase n=1 Tax=Sphingomonas immobilis TaxID=3063997 RepID=A0ABT9A1D9_9SPHN|nr:L-serine ammonia-lyase [Sphingomonas sp. CA1-15]MDO7843641.1 L-serine ammonia-lyase [Sphingomonas sp. CA1-15]